MSHNFGASNDDMIFDPQAHELHDFPKRRTVCLWCMQHFPRHIPHHAAKMTKEAIPLVVPAQGESDVWKILSKRARGTFDMMTVR
jgi:hypothetical protein